MIAAGVTFGFALLAAGVSMWIQSIGCVFAGNPTLSRWACLFPSLLALSAVLAAILLPLAARLSKSSGRAFSFGPLLTPLLTGVFSHVLLIGSYMILLDGAYRTHFLSTSFYMPQPFAAGALAGLIYWLILSFGEKRAAEN